MFVKAKNMKWHVESEHGNRKNKCSIEAVDVEIEGTADDIVNFFYSMGDIIERTEEEEFDDD